MGQDGAVKIARRGTDLARVRLQDAAGRMLELAVVAPSRTIRIVAAGPDGPEVRGALDPKEFNSVVSLLRTHREEGSAGLAGRFHVLRQVPGDQRGYVDWGTESSKEIWIYPNRRGAATDWCILRIAEVTEDFFAIWEAHRGR